MEGASLHASLIGATIGNYRVVAKLGEGGMGAVYLAEHPLIGKKVALKVLHEEYSANDEVVSRFFNEAKAVNDIGHPNIVDIIDYGVVATQGGPGFVYLNMEFLAGEPHATVIHRDAPLPPERALHIAAQIADSLVASHAKGIVHRDLKPDNVFLIQRPRERDFVKVLDFGIAKLTGNDGKSSRTRTGIVMGTPAYMSPEQCEGRGQIDPRTDVYALGIVLYEMITGRVPFAGDGYGEVLVQHLTKVPDRPSTIRGVIPPHVEAIVMKALEKKREARFASMEQMLAALRDPLGYVESNGGINAFYPLATPAGVPAPVIGREQTGGFAVEPPARPTTLGSGAAEIAPVYPARRSRLPVIAGAAIVSLALIAGGVLLATSGGDEAPAAETPVVQAAVTPVAPEPVVPEVPAPKPEVTPPPLKEVTISVVTSPAGAEVFVGAETAARGVTPLDLKVPKGSAPLELTLRAPGFKERKRVIRTKVDAMLEITLAPEPTVEPVKVDREAKRDDKKDRRKKVERRRRVLGDDDILDPTAR